MAKSTNKSIVDKEVAEGEKDTNSGQSHIVVQQFRDESNFDKIHSEGSDVSHFDADRLEKLIGLGLVEKK